MIWRIRAKTLFALVGVTAGTAACRVPRERSATGPVPATSPPATRRDLATEPPATRRDLATEPSAAVRLRRFIEAQPDPRAPSGQVRCEGQTWTEGHLETPEARVEDRVVQRYVRDDRSGRWTFFEAAQGQGGASERSLVLEGFRYAYRIGDQRVDLSAEEKNGFDLQLRAPWPQELLRFITAGLSDDAVAVATGYPVGDETTFLISTAPGGPAQVTFDRQQRLSQVVVSAHDPMRGDVRDSYRFTTEGGRQRVIRTRGGRLDHDLVCEAMRGPEPAASLVPGPLREVVPRPVPEPRLSVTRHADTMHAIDLSHLDHRVLVLEVRDGVWVFEAPVDSATGELVIAKVAATWPDKPIRKLFVTHHHPDHAGALRPFVARGVPIVTTPGNVAYFSEVARATFEATPDLQTLAPKVPVFEVVTGEASFGPGSERVVAYDVGPQTGHTREYLVFFHPKSGVLFHGDLTAMPSSGAVGPAGARSRGLFEAVTRRGLAVRTLIGAWPIHGYASTMPFGKLEAAVKLAR